MLPLPQLSWQILLRSSISAPPVPEGLRELTAPQLSLLNLTQKPDKLLINHNHHYTLRVPGSRIDALRDTDLSTNIHDYYYHYMNNTH